MLQIKTHTGDRQISKDSLIAFPKGLLGIAGCMNFKLFHSETNEFSGLYWLQCIEDPDVMFSVAIPQVVNIDYHFEMSYEEMALLQANEPADLLILLPLYKTNQTSDKEGAQDNTAIEVINASLKSPLIINLDARIGMQKVLHNVEISALIRENPIQ